MYLLMVQLNRSFNDLKYSMAEWTMLLKHNWRQFSDTWIHICQFLFLISYFRITAYFHLCTAFKNSYTTYFCTK
jgi:hypothetical protein